MATFSTVQGKAVLLIALLVGHEAVRVDLELQRGIAARNPVEGNEDGTEGDGDTEDELLFRKENGQCHLTLHGCVGGSENACKWRSLPLDVPLQSCRLTDDFMIESNRTKYFQIASGMLSAKSKKFAEGCNGTSFFHMTQNMRCARRSKQMMRAMKLMTKAQDEKLIEDLSDEQKAEEAQRFEDSLKNLATSIGEDGPAVLELHQKMKASADTAKDPKRFAKQTFTKMVEILQKLLRGSSADKEEARAAIQDYGEDDTTTADEVGDDEESVERSDEEMNALIDSADMLAPDGHEGQALLEMDQALSVDRMGQALVGDDNEQAAIVFVLVLMLMWFSCGWVWFGAYAFWWSYTWMAWISNWAFLSLIGCPLYTAGKDDVSKTNVQDFVQDSLKCTINVFLLPFKFVGRAAVGAYKALNDALNDKSLAQLEQAATDDAVACNTTNVSDA